MNICITIKAGDNDPIEVNVEVPESGNDIPKNPPRVDESAVWFDETCQGWTKNAEMNKHFLIMQQNYCNEKLRNIGYLFENDVRDCLGLPRTERGQLVGWIWDMGREQAVYVDFGLFADYNRAFLNGTDNKALLNFNVDGNILEYL